MAILPAPVTADTSWYLSLGTSLAAGETVDPINPKHLCDIVPETELSYTDKIAEYTGLQHLKLGCSGETIDSFRDGPSINCDYRAGSQLLQAKELIRKYGEDIGLITIDMGANDVLPCFALYPGPKDQLFLLQCVLDATQHVRTELEEIMVKLQDEVIAIDEDGDIVNSCV